MLERLTYQSQATQDFASLLLPHLLTQARLRNQQLGITGHLLYWRGQFTPCVEGAPRRSNNSGKACSATNATAISA